MQRYIVLVLLETTVMVVTSNVKVDGENNLYTDMSHDLKKALVFEDNGQALKNVKTTLKFNRDYKAVKVLVNY